jgi:hypothetical protein
MAIPEAPFLKKFSPKIANSSGAGSRSGADAIPDGENAAICR